MNENNFSQLQFLQNKILYLLKIRFTMLFEKIIDKPGSEFSHIVYKQFIMSWHYHPEYELIIVTAGGGKRFVGNTYVDEFKVGDLVLYGRNLPHFHLSYDIKNNNDNIKSSCEVIRFTKNIFPRKINSVKEFENINNLLERSKQGILFKSPQNIENIKSIMGELDKLTGIKRICTLYRFLEYLANQNDYKLMTKDSSNIIFMEKNKNETIIKVYNYITQNYNKTFSLDDIAKYVGFNSAALCRYFKRSTKKSIFECLAEIRINVACKLLINSSMNISQIAYDSGYKNLSNFNRQFKKITNKNPTEYRQLYRENGTVDTFIND
ncbi:MAG: helix-turn-helix domain-containing protein [Bacteroidetes bacterium]|nr:helix-turn-helix domain-containing protein [Bacteroidota bacterium]